jgi:hypothetical protein
VTWKLALSVVLASLALLAWVARELYLAFDAETLP